MCCSPFTRADRWAHAGKAAGTDKAIAREVEATLKDELDTSHSLVPVSPLGPVADKSTRTLLVNLIAVMNMAFPEHDFG